jgi:IMP dehydrogenase
MASAAAQNAWRGKVSSLEGVSSSVPYKGSLWGVLENLDRGMRSGLSYSGCRTIAELQAKAQWVKQTGASQVESSAHILRK